MDGEPPRVRPSLLPIAAQCRLRFVREVAGGVGLLRFSRANTDRSFLLRNLLESVIESAHAAPGHGPDDGLGALLHVEPPEGLLAEERWLFRRGLDHYVELAGERPGRPHAPPDRFVSLGHSSGRFALSLRLDPCFLLDDGAVEVRRIGFGAPRVAFADDPRILAQAVHLAREHPGAVRVVHLDLLHGAAREALLGRDRIARAARDIGELVLDALDDPDPRPVPGWWCHECPALRSCPAVSQQAPRELVLMATGEVSADAPVEAG